MDFTWFFLPFYAFIDFVQYLVLNGTTIYAFIFATTFYLGVLCPLWSLLHFKD